MIDLRLGDCLKVLPTLADGSVDAVVCDPPYDLTSGKRGSASGGFMGKAWDATGIAFRPETWQAVARVMKPGAYLLAFGGTRTSHRMTCAIEDAGFVIRDSIVWIHGQGFPKAKSCLKPGHEPIVLAWKPDRKATPLQIDACRIGAAPPSVPQPQFNSPTGQVYGMKTGVGRNGEMSQAPGRWPANVVLDEVAAAELDRQSGERKSGGKPGSVYGRKQSPVTCYGDGLNWGTSPAISDSGGASRFFFCPKASRTDRGASNAHPTCKSTSLMSWLVRLICPSGGTILDPFMGSGSTAIACIREGFDFIGIEQSPEYLKFARRRIKSAVASVA